jgi:hypothetical protein
MARRASQVEGTAQAKPWTCRRAWTVIVRVLSDGATAPGSYLNLIFISPHLPHISRWDTLEGLYGCPRMGLQGSRGRVCVQRFLNSLRGEVEWLAKASVRIEAGVEVV